MARHSLALPYINSSAALRKAILQKVGMDGASGYRREGGAAMIQLVGACVDHDNGRNTEYTDKAQSIHCFLCGSEPVCKGV